MPGYTAARERYRLGTEARCCYWPAYSQDKEFSIVSYDLYKHFRDNTPGFSDLAAFQAGGAPFGVRRPGARESAQSYPGEFVSGNYSSGQGPGKTNHVKKILSTEADSVVGP